MTKGGIEGGDSPTFFVRSFASEDGRLEHRRRRRNINSVDQERERNEVTEELCVHGLES